MRRIKLVYCTSKSPAFIDDGEQSSKIFDYISKEYIRNHNRRKSKWTVK